MSMSREATNILRRRVLLVLSPDLASAASIDLPTLRAWACGYKSLDDQRIGAIQRWLGIAGKS
jgi:hypothetical protein